jgi:hypothetical protein
MGPSSDFTVQKHFWTPAAVLPRRLHRHQSWFPSLTLESKIEEHKRPVPNNRDAAKIQAGLLRQEFLKGSIVHAADPMMQQNRREAMDALPTSALQQYGNAVHSDESAAEDVGVFFDGSSQKKLVVWIGDAHSLIWR